MQKPTIQGFVMGIHGGCPDSCLEPYGGVPVVIQVPQKFPPFWDSGQVPHGVWGNVDPGLINSLLLPTGAWLPRYRQCKCLKGCAMVWCMGRLVWKL